MQLIQKLIMENTELKDTINKIEKQLSDKISGQTDIENNQNIEELAKMMVAVYTSIDSKMEKMVDEIEKNTAELKNIRVAAPVSEDEEIVPTKRSRTKRIKEPFIPTLDTDSMEINSGSSQKKTVTKDYSKISKKLEED